MLKNSPSYSMFSVKDGQKAMKFYGKTLGLAVTEDHDGMFRVRLGAGGTVLVYPQPDHVPAAFTVINFPVKHIDEVVDALAKKGVSFIKYEGALKTDQKGIFRSPSTDLAWLKDPSGNIISIMEEK